MISRLQLPSLVNEVLSFSIDLSGGLAPSSLDLGGSLGKNSLLGIVHFAELVEINVGSLDDLDLSDLNVLDGVDGGDLLGDLLLNNLTGEEIKDLGSVGLGNLLGNDVVDSLSDDLLLGRKGVVGLSLLVGRLPGEGNHEDSEDISVLRLDILDGFNKGLSLLDEGAKLVTSDVDTIERGDGLSAFGLINNQLDFSPVEAVLVGSQISLHLFDDSALDAVFDLFWHRKR
jgi:hypothetical protein